MWPCWGSPRRAPHQVLQAVGPVVMAAFPCLVGLVVMEASGGPHRLLRVHPKPLRLEGRRRLRTRTDRLLATPAMRRRHPEQVMAPVAMGEDAGSNAGRRALAIGTTEPRAPSIEKVQ